MAKQAKTGNRNDARSSGKAAKQNPGRKAHGSKSVKLTELQKIQMGKGLYVRYERLNAEGLRSLQGKKNKN